MLVVLANPALAVGAAAIAYRVEIVVPGDPTLAGQMQQISQLVARGPPYRLREVKVIAPGGGVPPGAERLKPGDIGLEIGMRAQSAPILAAEDKLQRFYTTRGWPLAKVTAHQAVIDRADQSMHV